MKKNVNKIHKKFAKKMKKLNGAKIGEAYGWCVEDKYIVVFGANVKMPRFFKGRKVVS